MFRTFALASAVVMTGLVAGLQPEGPRPPTGHPSLSNPTQNPEEEVKPSPPANPEDVASVDSIISTYYRAMSGGSGEERQWDRLGSLFLPKARMIACRPLDKGAADAWVLRIGDYIEFNRVYMQKGGYFEKEVARRVEAFGNIAQVWSTYEARKVADSPEPYSRGIYSFQLLKDGDRWWIVNAFWDYERPDSPIPENYLKTP